MQQRLIWNKQGGRKKLPHSFVCVICARLPKAADHLMTGLNKSRADY